MFRLLNYRTKKLFTLFGQTSRYFSTAKEPTKSNVKVRTGILCLTVLTFPYWSNFLQEAYWSFRYRELNKKEILSDRFQWLHECMLKDEIESQLIKK